ncbi:MAG: hypothetical protein CVT77_17220 [Alphaproteobacteria bacterium HGW-Alphaproteobacteria-16]|nr:MAG: hypothetical protein CVT77_17220 [Alphaproteobacteria bacterium HGW-Alphaproteobacteria-16]
MQRCDRRTRAWRHNLQIAARCRDQQQAAKPDQALQRRMHAFALLQREPVDRRTGGGDRRYLDPEWLDQVGGDGLNPAAPPAARLMHCRTIDQIAGAITARDDDVVHVAIARGRNRIDPAIDHHRPGDA